MIFKIKKYNETEIISSNNFSLGFNEEKNNIFLKLDNYVYYLDVSNNKLKKTWTDLQYMLTDENVIKNKRFLVFECNFLFHEKNKNKKFHLNQIFFKEIKLINDAILELLKLKNNIFISNILKTINQLNYTIEKGNITQSIPELIYYIKTKDLLNLNIIKFDITVENKTNPIKHFIYYNKLNEKNFDLKNEYDKIKEDFAYIKGVNSSLIQNISISKDEFLKEKIDNVI